MFEIESEDSITEAEKETERWREQVKHRQREWRCQLGTISVGAGTHSIKNQISTQGRTRLAGNLIFVLNRN